MIDSNPPVKISKQALDSLIEKQNLLVSLVDSELAALANINVLLGNNPFSIAHTNHENHIRFISTVLSFGAKDLLINMLPWVYRSYHSHGVSYDYFPVVLKAWEKVISATLTQEESKEIIPLYHWMRAQHSNVIIEAESSSNKSSIQDNPGGIINSDFLAAILQGDHRTATQLAFDYVQDPSYLAGFYIKTIQSSLWNVGEMWEHGLITVAQEHLASATVGNVMANLYSRTRFTKKQMGVAIVTTASGEFHEICSRMVADLLETDGWEVKYLGANTPPEDVASLCASMNAKFAAISVTMHFNLPSAGKIIEAIRQHSDKTRILVGGQAFANPSELWRTIGADAYGADVATSVDLARSWV
ncbi:cobalamin-dependent protein [bacterium]|nr:cobalamin-dependent protein [bacterium]